MDMTLTRNPNEYRQDGIFSLLTANDGDFQAHTLEHAYLMGSLEAGQGHTWIAKLAPGTYTCKRGLHRLHGMTEDFETFEVTGVPDFEGNPVTGLLLHWGNWNKDSEGCILVGKAEADSAQGHMVTGSRDEFAAFMALQDGCDTFQLTVQ